MAIRIRIRFIGRVCAHKQFDSSSMALSITNSTLIENDFPSSHYKRSTSENKYEV